jgi:hypothetical protein
MADDRTEPREVSWRQLLPWTELFRGFQVALDLNKLLLAAAGIVVMAFGWWLLSVIFTANDREVPPAWPTDYKSWSEFKQARDHWNLMHEAAGIGRGPQTYAVEDLASTQQEYDHFKDVQTGARYQDEIEKLLREGKIDAAQAREYRTKVNAYARLGREKPAGTLSTWPWSEHRGPNPYLLVTGQAGVPWEAGRFWDWFLRDQVPVLIEPLVKFCRPIIYFLSSRADTYSRFYFLCVLLWTLLTWAFFGGAITRIAAVQVARGEKIGLTEAVRFTARRFLSFFTAPLFPLVFVFVLLVFMVIYGWVGMIPILGDILVNGLFWPLMIAFGLVMAVALVGLVGWPLMSATVSAEGTDSWEAVSRSYSYVYQRPWHYIWYSIVAICYGAVVVFFVGFMGSLMVYLAKWGVARTPWIDAAERNPAYLCVWAPNSWGWRPLLLQGATAPDGSPVVKDGHIDPGAYAAYTAPPPAGNFHWYNRVGAAMVAFWLGLVFLLILGFGYSFFWSEGVIIYLLMRRNVDAAELDEVYLEEDEQEGAYGAPLTGSQAVTPTPGKPGTSLPVVEPPAPRPAPATMGPASPAGHVTTPPVPPEPVAEAPPAPREDRGEPYPGGLAPPTPLPPSPESPPHRGDGNKEPPE